MFFSTSFVQDCSLIYLPGLDLLINLLTVKHDYYCYSVLVGMNATKMKVTCATNICDISTNILPTENIIVLGETCRKHFMTLNL